MAILIVMNSGPPLRDDIILALLSQGFQTLG